MPVLQPTLLLEPILQDAILSESGRCAPEDGTNASAATIRLALWDSIPMRLLSTPTCCWWAALAFIAATPSLLRHGPTCLPICEAIGAIVRIGRCNGLWSWQDDGLRWRCSWRATAVVDSAAPRFLVGGPSVLGINSAVEGIRWSDGCWRSCGRRSRWR